MISLYQYLLENKNYTEAEADETIIRYDVGMDIPDKVKQDIDDYWHDEFMTTFHDNISDMNRLLDS